MAQIDRIKETLSTMRMLFGMLIVVLLAIGSGVLAMYKINEFNPLFWLGLCTELIIFAAIITISLKLNKKIEEIEKY